MMSAVKFKRFRLYVSLTFLLIIVFLYLLISRKQQINSDKNLEQVKRTYEKIVEKNFEIKQHHDLNENEILIEHQTPRIRKNESNFETSKNYINSVDALRINKLFKLLKEKEKNLAPILDALKIVSFEKFIESPDSDELAKYLTIQDNQVVVTDNFLNYLLAKSDLHSFQNARNNVKKSKIENVRIQINFKFKI
jgi:hypothetical protein